MSLSQMRAVTNRRLKPNYVDAINAQTPYLPQLYRQKEDDAYKTKVYDQTERGLTQAADIARRGELLTQDQLDDQKKQNKKAQRIGWANTALSGATGLAGLYQASKPLTDSLKPDLANVATDVIPKSADIGELFGNSALASATGKPVDFATGDQSFVSDVGDFATDYLIDPIKNIGSSIWDAGASFLDDIGGLFS